MSITKLPFRLSKDTFDRFLPMFLFAGLIIIVGVAYFNSVSAARMETLTQTKAIVNTNVPQLQDSDSSLNLLQPATSTLQAPAINLQGSQNTIQVASGFQGLATDATIR